LLVKSSSKAFIQEVDSLEYKYKLVKEKQKEKNLCIHIFKKRPDRILLGHFFCFQLKRVVACVNKRALQTGFVGCSSSDGSLKIIAIIQIRNSGGRNAGRCPEY
jgi:hypothetical protein